jgi:hypothetical protein
MTHSLGDGFLIQNCFNAGHRSFNICILCIVAQCSQEVNGLRDWEQQIVSLLKQASCFGNHDATFMLASILNYGLVVKTDELQVISLRWLICRWVVKLRKLKMETYKKMSILCSCALLPNGLI